jgi:hypothetical protein
MRLEYYGGDGFGGLPNFGLFCIKIDGASPLIGENESFELLFTNLSRARKVYDALNCGKAFWDLSRSAELCDAYYEV